MAARSERDQKREQMFFTEIRSEGKIVVATIACLKERWLEIPENTQEVDQPTLAHIGERLTRIRQNLILEKGFQKGIQSAIDSRVGPMPSPLGIDGHYSPNQGLHKEQWYQEVKRWEKEAYFPEREAMLPVLQRDIKETHSYHPTILVDAFTKHVLAPQEKEKIMDIKEYMASMQEEAERLVGYPDVLEESFRPFVSGLGGTFRKMQQFSGIPQRLEAVLMDTSDLYSQKVDLSPLREVLGNSALIILFGSR